LSKISNESIFSLEELWSLKDPVGCDVINLTDLKPSMSFLNSSLEVYVK